jgi:uncharacterized protein DUF3572
MLSGHNKQQPMNATRAEAIAATALAFLAEDAVRLAQFLSVTGLSLQDLRRQAASHQLLAAVLEYLADNESLLLVFASGAGLSPTEVAPARDVLLGTPQHGGP